ncbi:hypothetical protein SY88_23300, partial [Clostridiales bacterium PH28_bin88]
MGREVISACRVFPGFGPCPAAATPVALARLPWLRSGHGAEHPGWPNSFRLGGPASGGVPFSVGGR